MKMLAIDGVDPSKENISKGTYPACVPVVCARLMSNDDPYVQFLIDFILSDDGQELVEKTGYVPLSNHHVDFIIENKIEERVPLVYTADNWILNIYSEKDIEDGADFELLNPDRYYKGRISDHRNDKDGSASFSLDENDGLFVVYFDHEEGKIIFRKVEEAESGLFLPDEETVFVLY